MVVALQTVRVLNTGLVALSVVGVIHARNFVAWTVAAAINVLAVAVVTLALRARRARPAGHRA